MIECRLVDRDGGAAGVDEAVLGGSLAADCVMCRA